jgi:hypothetical protein
MISKISLIGGAVSPPLHLGTNDTNDRSLVVARLSGTSSGMLCVWAFVVWSVILVSGILPITT